MNSRERVLTALEHKEPDKIPFDMGAYSATSMVVKAYQKLRSYLGLKEVKERLLNIATQVSLFDEDFLECLKVDTRMVPSQASRDFKLIINEDTDNYIFKDEWGASWRMPKKYGLYYDMYNHPLNHQDNVSLEDYKWPCGNDVNRVNGLREKAKKYQEEGYFVSFGETIGNGFLNMGAQLEGYDDFFIDLALGTSRAERILDKILEIKLDFWSMVLDEMGDCIDIVCERDDLGTQRGPLISTEMFNKYIYPRKRKLFNFIKNNTNAKIFFHSCGSVNQFIPKLIEAGVDILNPIQVGAEEMGAKKLKNEYGKDLVFWGGGVDTQNILPCASPEKVKEHVKRQINDFAYGGGYVFATDQAIQEDVPMENILAMWETLQKEGVY